MTAADSFIGALHAYKVREVGPDRLRAICPVCGARNPNTLSVGVTTDGAVLVKCFKSGCSIEDICAAVGLTVADLFPPRASNCPPLKRRRLLSAGQALQLLDQEALLVAVCAANIAQGVALSDEDRARCLSAAGRIAYLRDESRA